MKNEVAIALENALSYREYYRLKEEYFDHILAHKPASALIGHLTEFLDKPREVNHILKELSLVCSSQNY